MGANGQVIQTSNHVSTHMDGEIHFYGHGRAIGHIGAYARAERAGWGRLSRSGGAGGR